MTTTTTSAAPSTAGRIRWAAPVHTLGAAAIGLIGVAHLLVIHVFGDDTAAEEAVNELSRNTTTSMFEGGKTLTVFGLNTGYSVGMGVFGIAVAALVILAARSAPQLITRWSPFNWTCVGAAGVLCWIAVLYFPEPAVALCVLATACFAAVLVAGNRAPS